MKASAENKAKEIYTDAYSRWCYELSHDKNVLIAKNISSYICDVVLGNTLEDDLSGYVFWREVKRIVTEYNHGDLYGKDTK